jgi:hypothetical protein
MIYLYFIHMIKSRYSVAWIMSTYNHTLGSQWCTFHSMINIESHQIYDMCCWESTRHEGHAGGFPSNFPLASLFDEELSLMRLHGVNLLIFYSNHNFIVFLFTHEWIVFHTDMVKRHSGLMWDYSNIQHKESKTIIFTHVLSIS